MRAWLLDFIKGYTLADFIYVGMLLSVVACLGVGHRLGKVNLWDCVTATKDGRTFTDGRKLHESGAFVVMTVGFSYLLLIGRMTEWYAVIYIGAFVTSRFLRDREQRLNRALEPKQSGFAQLELLLAVAAVAALGLTYWLGGSTPRAELADLRASVQRAQDESKREADRRRTQTETLLKEKDDDRTKELARVGGAWSAEYDRLRADRDRLARDRAQPAGDPPRVCDGADGNQRLRDALRAADDAADRALADYQDGTGRDLEVCQRQTAEWDNLKAAVTGVRTLNQEAR